MLDILIDGREFKEGRMTGIGRVLSGLVSAICANRGIEKIGLAVWSMNSIPQTLKETNRLEPIVLPNSFLASEKLLSKYTTTGIKVFLSPYPKLPLFGCRCAAINMVHDVHDLTHPAYRHRLRVKFDLLRLKSALKNADLTWYVSKWSMNETRSLTGIVGKRPIVRYSGVSKDLSIQRTKLDGQILDKHNLDRGYILVIGNGLPHKNLGVLLSISGQIERKLLFVGVNRDQKKYWARRFSLDSAIWIDFVEDRDLPAIIRGAFCLAHPSTAEGYGFPPLEAMACGIPAVVSDISVLAETTGKKALLTEPNNPDHWLENLNVLNNNATYEKIAAEGIEWVRQFLGESAWQGHLNDISHLIEDR
ncbi:MAG: glycosyltransferase family 4 protein [Bacteroidetes bacterium]|nr:glycosyltransferase family 4 protein [Bacteroidota bacterium]